MREASLLVRQGGGSGTSEGSVVRRHRLITIPISHFCEKARWALEWGGIPYYEERHLQGFHVPHVYRISKRDTVPVLITAEGKVIADSTGILKWVDSGACREKKLYPANIKCEVENFEDDLDKGFGVAGRLWMYSFMLDPKQRELILRYSKTHGVPRFETALMALLFPLVKWKIESWLEITADAHAKAEQDVSATLDRIAARLSDGRRFLFGGRFTAADLTFASLAAAILIPDHYGARLPLLSELPTRMTEQIRKWRSHPAGRFALRLYAENR